MHGGKACCLCGETKANDCFSKKKWEGKAHARKCLGCSAAGPHVGLPAQRLSASAGSSLDAKGVSSDEGDECLVCLDDLLTVAGKILQVKYLRALFSPDCV